MIHCILHCPHCGKNPVNGSKYLINGCWVMICNHQKSGCGDAGKVGNNPSPSPQYCRIAESQRMNFSLSCSYGQTKKPSIKIKTILGWTWPSLVRWCKHLREICALSLSDFGIVVEMDESKVFDSGYSKRRIKLKIKEHLSEQMWRKQHEDDLWFGLLNTLAKTKHATSYPPKRLNSNFAVCASP